MRLPSIALWLAFAASLGLTACSDNDAAKTTTPAATEPATPATPPTTPPAP